MNKKAVVGVIGYGLLGQQIVSHLRTMGYRVLVFDIAPKNHNDFFQMDICNETSVAEAIRNVKQKSISIDAIINCSYPRGPNYGRKLEDVALKDFNENINLHLGGYFNVMKQFGLYLKETGGGTVVSFSSIYGVIAPRFDIYDGFSFTMPVEYAAIKAAILHLNKYMAKYFKGSDVRFNSISPGGIFDGHNEKFVEAYGRYSLGQKKEMLSPQALVEATEFLVSSGAKHINGQNLVVDDGWTL